MKVAFFTEGTWQGKVETTHPNMRTDLAWMVALDAIHIPIYTALRSVVDSVNDQFDIGIIILPKQNIEEIAQYDLCRLRSSGLCKMLAIMQEGPSWYWKDWPVDVQIWYYTSLLAMDFILCHNEIDKLYYTGLLGRNDVFKLPTLLLTDPLDETKLTSINERTGAIIGGNFVSWYDGFDSYIIASLITDDIYAPSMGRKQPGEYLIENIKYLPYLQWRDWMYELSKRRYAIHLMRTKAAGTFALNCAYLGIPCVAYNGIDTVDICHPDTSVAEEDLVSARKIIKRLANDEDFYMECSISTRRNWEKYYKIDVFVENFIVNTLSKIYHENIISSSESK